MAIASSVSLQQPFNCLIFKPQLKGFRRGCSARPRYFEDTNNGIRPIKAATQSAPFPLFHPPQAEDSPSEPADPDLYKIGYVPSNGPLRRARVSWLIPRLGDNGNTT